MAMGIDGFSSANPASVAGAGMLKASIEMQGQGALQLINSVSAPVKVESPAKVEAAAPTVTPSENLPDNLGKNLNVVA